MKIVDEYSGIEAQHVNLGACIVYGNFYYICSSANIRPDHVTFTNLETGKVMSLSDEVKVRVIDAKVVIGE